MKNTIFILTMIFCATVMADQYLCVADLATGFVFDESVGKWKESRFNASGNKYQLAPFEEGGYKYRVTELGKEYALANCKNDFDKYGYISCSKLWVVFKFNKNNGRYLRVNEIGYFNVLPGENGTSDATSHHPMIEIGTCSPVSAD